MKTLIFGINDLILEHADKLCFAPLNIELHERENLIIFSHQHLDLLSQLHCYLSAKQNPLSGHLTLVSEHQFSIIFPIWLDSLNTSAHSFEYYLNHFLMRNQDFEAQTILELLEFLNCTQYFKLPLSTLTVNMTMLMKFALCIILRPQIICLSQPEIEMIKVNNHFEAVLKMCEQQHISLIILTNDPTWKTMLNQCQVKSLDDLLIEPDTIENLFQPNLNHDEYQLWQLYHEIKKHLNTEDFKLSSLELQEKILTIYSQYQQQLNQIDPSLLHHSPDGTLETNDWLQKKSQLTKMLFSESLNENDEIEEMSEHTTSTFEPIEETQPFIKANKTAKLHEAIEQIETFIDVHEITRQHDSVTTVPQTTNLTIKKTLTSELKNQSTVLIPPTDIDKIKKPKNSLFKDLFHLKNKK